MNPDQLIAHRGWQRRYPENTLLSVSRAVEVGARYVEVDVQLSADGVPFLFHDESLARLCNRHGPLGGYPADVLDGLCVDETGRLGTESPTPSLTRLDAVVAYLLEQPAVHLFVEIKPAAVTHGGAETVHSTVAWSLREITDRCTLISYDYGYLQHARRNGWYALGPVLRAWDEIDAQALRALEPTVIFADYKGVPGSTNLAALPAPLALYEVDDPVQADHLLARGARWVETFAIGEMLQAD